MKNKICSMHNAGVFAAMVVCLFASEATMISSGYQWKQLVLPNFDHIMGV